MTFINKAVSNVVAIIISELVPAPSDLFFSPTIYIYIYILLYAYKHNI